MHNGAALCLKRAGTRQNLHNVERLNISHAKGKHFGRHVSFFRATRPTSYTYYCKLSCCQSSRQRQIEIALAVER